MKKLYQYPWIILIAVLGVTVFLGLQLPNLTLDNEVMNFVPENDPPLLDLEDFTDQYGSSLVMALVVSDPYRTLLNRETLDTLVVLSEELEELEGLDEVQSIANVDYIEGRDGGLQAGSIIEDSSGSPLPPDEIGRRLNSWEMYDLMLLSEDGHSTQMGLSLNMDLEAEESEALYHEIDRIAQEILPEHFEYYIAGLPATTIQVSLNMRSDLALLIPFVVILVLLILYLSFRRLGGVILPILNVVVSTLWTLGLMALLEVPLTILGSIIPILMVAVGSAYGIHLVSHYYDEKAHSDLDSKELIAHTVKVVGLPVAMAGLTTIAGFGALAVSSVIPMRIFGIFTAVGVAAALVVALTLIPALLLLHPVKAAKEQETHRRLKLIDTLHYWTTKRRGVMALFFLILLGGSIFFIPQVVVDNNIVEYFKANTEVRQSEDFIAENFAGTSSFNILVRGQEPGSMNNPEALQFMEDYKEWILSEYPEVRKILSYSDFVQRLNQVLHQEDPGRISLSAALGQDWSNSGYNEEETGLWGDEQTDSLFENDSFFAEDSSFSDSFSNEDSFFTQDSSFSQDSFFSDSPSDDGFFSDESSWTEADYSTPAQIENSADDQIMAALWTAYLNQPENFMEELARMTNHQGMDYYEIPTNPERYNLSTNEDLQNLIAQYLLLFSGNLSQWSNESLEPSEARMSVQLQVNSTSFVDQIIPELQDYADQFLPQGYEVVFVGTALVQSSLTQRIVRSAVFSIILSVFLVFLILSFTYKSPLAGLIGVVPLSLTVLVNFGVMGLTGIPMDISTAMVGSIAIGIGIDYTIHFLSSYQYHWRRDRSPEEVTHWAMNSSGKAILFNALSVAAGFAVLLFSRFNPLMYLGLLIVLTMGTSSLASLTLLPLLLNKIKPKFLEKNHSAQEAKEKIA